MSKPGRRWALDGVVVAEARNPIDGNADVLQLTVRGLVTGQRRCRTRDPDVLKTAELSYPKTTVLAPIQSAKSCSVSLLRRRGGRVLVAGRAAKEKGRAAGEAADWLLSEKGWPGTRPGSAWRSDFRSGSGTVRPVAGSNWNN